MTFTPEAVRQLESVNITILRVGVRGGGCSGYEYTMAGEVCTEPNPGDKVFQLTDGLKVYVDPISYMYLKGTQLHYKEGLMTAGFEFLNPQATKTCGCGQSFSA